MKAKRMLFSGSGKVLGVAFAFFISVFIITHILEFPGSLAYYMQKSGGQRIFDMKPSFDVTEFYQRLDLMGAKGREAYLQLILTIDFVFPIVAGLFLFVWGRFFLFRSRMSDKVKVAVSALPLIYFISDLVENISILIILKHYPDSVSLLAGAVAYVTVIKRTAMMASLFLPPVVFVIKRKVPASF